MGISGLLPVLKPIQAQKHLSEFSGQTLAVDAYVWLHRGVYACASDIAMGKKTTKYVDYCMHRVRLLLHHHIQPFIVFDGGPLPAKAPTEVARKQRREESLAKGKELAKQGKWKEAREYFVKSVDVGTQMAFQLIKALRAEGVPYIVAPYEADAQLAYLERIGLVDGIITEDSDLLVFGCQTVLFKLDAVSATVTCIQQRDFASVTAANSNGISLQTFTPAQFREMCMLSGCDYLPSIPGIGLKTAYALLRKYKTVENVVKAVRLEGKKDVPKGYVEMFRLAEKAFFYQRVWDPVQEKLVCLTDIVAGDELDEEADKYVGGDLEPALAKKIAEGDFCPITLEAMQDINADYVPRPARRAPLLPTNTNGSVISKVSDKGKGKGKASDPNGGILSYFARKTKETAPPLHRVKSCPMIVGRASGKRTLVDVMDQDIEAKKKKKKEEKKADIPTKRTSATTRSRFFGMSASTSSGVCAESDAGPSSAQNHHVDKENVLASNEEDVFMEEVSIVDDNNVAQEDGYISPAHSVRWDTPELSSPPKPARRDGNVDADDDFGADRVSSPIIARSRSVDETHKETVDFDRSMFALSDSKFHEDAKKGINLRDVFGDDDADETCGSEADVQPPVNSFSSTNSGSTSMSTSAGPVTPEDSVLQDDDIQLDLDFDVEEDAAKESKFKQEIVASGWWNKWAASSGTGSRKYTPLRRTETTVTTDGRCTKSMSVSARQPRALAVDVKAAAGSWKSHVAAGHSRKSLVFEEVRRPATPSIEPPAFRERPGPRPESAMSVNEAISRAKDRLAVFRCRTP